ncbi:Lpp/OprI family alanine-zipper lipoprotein [Nitrosomonas sp. Is35]|uniref:Lpp/OprI family alanine-zipper lipoprotein n=1 Tax=unclassified Nitrosomonas TaxID=2609265 RepID=UPI00294B749F|nr:MULTISPECIES: Lpp/OprI family alanine-zipper lipoprotein [unclassified Nitrosomonas]MDV6342584.1 Lpp/OprI family alanine-zipper lipoprotein [Nitrosomonas sp. Is24]MDV6348484.1 Lpp/OprI family alanine-zipper lipoprotein [Nitrosomonas sp. Is35]
MKGKIQHPVRMLTLAAIAGAIIGLTGCATTGQLEELQNKVNADIAAVKADAAAAKAAADAANAKANDALRIADEANRRSIDTESKIDRMFKKAMHK